MFKMQNSVFRNSKNDKDPGFPKRAKSEMFNKYWFSKFRDFLRDA